MSKALSVPKTFMIPKNRYWFQDPSALQTTDKLTIKKLPVHPTGPTCNLPRDKVEEDGNCLVESSSDLHIQNLHWIWNLGETSKPWLTENWCVIFQHTRRQGNMIAHSLARTAYNFPPFCTWMEEVPLSSFAVYFAKTINNTWAPCFLGAASQKKRCSHPTWTAFIIEWLA